MFENEDYAEDDADNALYLVVQILLLKKSFGGLLCPKCKQPNVRFEMTNTILGFAAKARTYCSNCGSVVFAEIRSKRADGSSYSQVPFEVKRLS